MHIQSTRMRIYLACFVIAPLVAACGGGGGGGGGGEQINTEGQWLIPTSFVADGGPGKDGIPSIQNPQFESAATITTVDDGDLVIVVRDGDQVKAYPHDIMDYHEIVNDGPDSDPFTMSYCPLTGSAVVWQGTVAHADSSYGVSGLLYNSNLLLYDRETDSIWSQILQLAVFGDRSGEKARSIQALETSFGTLKAMYPEAQVMTRNTGHTRDYDRYPYGNYKESPSFLFSVERQDNRMGAKARVIGIHDDDSSKVYQLALFDLSTKTINDQFNSQAIIVVGNSVLNYAAIYSRVLSDGSVLSFEPIQDDLPNVMSDTEGNVWDIFGTAVSGPRAGAQLSSVNSYTAMWFAWAAHFETVEIHFN
jgi:hypothetical protein